MVMGPSQVTKLFVATIARWWIVGYGRDAKHFTAWRRWLQGGDGYGAFAGDETLRSQHRQMVDRWAWTGCDALHRLAALATGRRWLQGDPSRFPPSQARSSEIT
jgi:hypothetical protein